MGGRKRRLWLVQTELTVWNVPLPPKNAPASKRYTEAGEFTAYHLKIFKKQSKETGKNSQFRPILKAFDYTTASLRQVSRSPHSSWESGWRQTAHKGGNEEEADAFGLDTSYSHFPPVPSNPSTPGTETNEWLSDIWIQWWVQHHLGEKSHSYSIKKWTLTSKHFCGKTLWRKALMGKSLNWKTKSKVTGLEKQTTDSRKWTKGYRES